MIIKNVFLQISVIESSNLNVYDEALDIPVIIVINAVPSPMEIRIGSIRVRKNENLRLVFSIKFDSDSVARLRLQDLSQAETIITSVITFGPIRK